MGGHHHLVPGPRLRILFCLGAVGLLVRRNPLIMFMCVELMLNAVNITFVAFGRSARTTIGGHQVIVFFVLVVAAAEVVVGLALIVADLPSPAGRHRRRHLGTEGLRRTHGSTSSG